MVRSLLVVTMLVGAMTLSQGCMGRLVSESIEKGLGPTAKTLRLEPFWPEKNEKYLAQYKNFEVGKITSEFPPTPQLFMAYFPGKLREQILSKGLPTDRPGKTLLINVVVMAYQPALSYEKAIGPTEEVVARVTLTDRDSGAIVGQAICIGRTYQSVGLGPKWKAWGLARAVINKWINDYYPKEGRVEKEEQAPPKGE